MKRKAGDIKMLLKIISTGSQAGNSYALIADNGERLLLDAGATYACLVWNIGLKKADRWKRRVMSNGLFQEMPEMWAVYNLYGRWIK